MYIMKKLRELKKFCIQINMFHVQFLNDVLKYTHPWSFPKDQL